jgi:hypothetical protein
MPSRSFRNNNCGNIRWSAFAERYGAVEVDGEMAHFPTVVQGLAAMVALLATTGYRHLSLLDAISRYAPSSDNNHPREYATYVAHRAGVTLETKLSEMDPFQLLRVVEAMIRFEGWASK